MIGGKARYPMLNSSFIGKSRSYTNTEMTICRLPKNPEAMLVQVFPAGLLVQQVKTT